MKDYYTSGEFARKANVTVRTLRFYDKEGILKPSRVNSAGYRMYTDEDFGRLQKILSLKYLGFSLEEIMAMTINDDAEDIARSLAMQRELIRRRIRHLELMEQTLDGTARVAACRRPFWSGPPAPLTPTTSPAGSGRRSTGRGFLWATGTTGRWTKRWSFPSASG